MNFENLVKWYFYLGAITAGIGVIRNLLGKQNTEADPTSVMSWFFAWWLYIGILIGKVFKKIF